jgi:hypothetical protein
VHTVSPEQIAARVSDAVLAAGAPDNVAIVVAELPADG